MWRITRLLEFTDRFRVHTLLRVNIAQKKGFVGKIDIQRMGPSDHRKRLIVLTTKVIGESRIPEGTGGKWIEFHSSLHFCHGVGQFARSFQVNRVSLMDGRRTWIEVQGPVELLCGSAPV